ncbi:hypothetical protein BX600DRAFT_446778 [Xylariales sp. PMI_506]|nr:hypothetical protein BX600DRAFT_446778 [Xylariales sp. PMI_506]
MPRCIWFYCVSWLPFMLIFPGRKSRSIYMLRGSCSTTRLGATCRKCSRPKVVWKGGIHEIVICWPRILGLSAKQLMGLYTREVVCVWLFSKSAYTIVVKEIALYSQGHHFRQ